MTHELAVEFKVNVPTEVFIIIKGEFHYVSYLHPG